MTDGVLITYPTLAAIAAQFGDGALKIEATRILTELLRLQALADDLAADLAMYAPRSAALARYQEASQRG